MIEPRKVTKKVEITEATSTAEKDTTPIILSEEQSQEQYSEKKQKEFFDEEGEDTEIIEINWD